MTHNHVNFDFNRNQKNKKKIILPKITTIKKQIKITVTLKKKIRNNKYRTTLLGNFVLLLAILTLENLSSFI